MKKLSDKSSENQRYQKEFLAMMLNNKDVYIKAIDFIRPKMFTGTNRLIFDAYVKLLLDGKVPDPVSISRMANLPIQEVLAVATFYSGAPLQINALLHELFEFMAQDIYIKLCMNISQQIAAGTESDEIRDIIIKTMQELELGSSGSVITMPVGVNYLWINIKNNLNDKHITGIATGLKLIDVFMGGLHEGDLIIIAGEISHGKTALALSMMFYSAVRFGIACGIISHEMTSDQLMARFAAYTTNISAKHLLVGKLSDNQLSHFADNIDKLVKANIFIQDYIKRELADTLAAIRLMVMQKHVKYVVVENAGNISVKGKHGDEERTAEISKSLKSLALELKIPIILISHLAREREGRKVQPEIHRLKHSGQLEQDADVVIFVYRPELHGYDTFQGPDENDIPTHGRAKTFIAKGRNYGLAKTYPDFIEELVMFRDHEEQITSQIFLSPNPSF
jgi:replicative DNA helicase